MRRAAVDYKLAEFHYATHARVVQKSKYDIAAIGCQHIRGWFIYGLIGYQSGTNRNKQNLGFLVQDSCK